MMKRIYTVYDSAAEAYLEPFFARSHGEAVRSFEDAVNTEGHPFQRHPDDYTLYYIGTFTEDSGAILGDNHVSLGNGPELVARRLEVAS